MAKVSDYKAWCRAQMQQEGHPAYGSRVSIPTSNDYLYKVIGGYRVPDAYQKMWHWIVGHSTIDPNGKMHPHSDLPRFYADDEDDGEEAWWQYGMRLCNKWIGRDGIIRYEVTTGEDEVLETISASIDRFDDELEELGFLYDDYEDYGDEPEQIPFNYCYVNKDGERRRLIDAPSYGC